MDKLWKQFRFIVVVIMPFSVNHISESKISAHFPQWFSEQLGKYIFHIMIQL